MTSKKLFLQTGTVAAGLLALVSAARAATDFTVPDGVYNTATNWGGGLPTSANPGTIAIASRSNNSSAINWNGATINLTAGGAISAASTANSAFNTQNLVFNMTGGSVNARYILANGTGCTYRISGGLLSTDNVSGTAWTSAGIGSTNGAKFYISGSASLKSPTADFTNASSLLDIAAGWTGSWNATTYTPGNWKAQFTNTADTSRMTYNGAVIDDATFDATFKVSEDGKTLSLLSAGLSPQLQVAATTTLSNNGHSATLQVPISNPSGDGVTALNLGTVTASGPTGFTVSNIVAPASLPAGQSGTISFDFNPSAGAGSYAFILNIPSNDAAAASPRAIFVTVEVAANPLLTVNPTFSFANAGGLSSYSIPISNTGTDGVTNLSISGVTATGTDAAAVSNIMSPATLSPGGTENIWFDFTPGFGAGTYQFNLEVASNDMSKPSPRVLAVTMVVTDPSISVNTQKIDLGTLAPASGPQVITIPVTNNGGTQNLVIDQEFTTITGSPAFTVTSWPAPIIPGGSGDLVVTFNPGAADGKFAGTLTILSNDSAARMPQIPLAAFVSPTGNQVAVDFGTATSALATGYTRFVAAEGASQSINGVNVQLSSSSSNIVGGTGASGDSLMSDYAATNFNGAANTYISVRLTGLRSGTLKFLSSHSYNNSNSLPIDVLFGEAGGSLTLVADNITRGSTASHTATVEAGKTYEIRVLEQGNANLAYISGLLLWGDAVPDPPQGYAGWASAQGLSGNPNADFDGDGIADAIEFFTGSNPKTANPANPVTVTTSGGNVVFTFLRDDAAEVPGTTATVEIGSTLSSTWPTILSVGADTASSSATVQVTENGSAPDTITVTRPRGSDIKIFGRLKVTVQ